MDLMLFLVIFFIELLVFELDADYLHAFLHDFYRTG